MQSYLQHCFGLWQFLSLVDLDVSLKKKNQADLSQRNPHMLSAAKLAMGKNTGAKNETKMYNYSKNCYFTSSFSHTNTHTHQSACCSWINKKYSPCVESNHCSYPLVFKFDTHSSMDSLLSLFLLFVCFDFVFNGDIIILKTFGSCLFLENFKSLDLTLVETYQICNSIWSNQKNS